MFKYDIPYAKEGQLTLLVNNVPINVSKKKSYLIGKMNAHRVDCGKGYEAVYSIVDTDGNVVFSRRFAEDEDGTTSVPYRTQKKETVCYVLKNGFSLIADESGKIKTDEELLAYLYDFRFYNTIPVMITNTALVSMATYKPTTEEEFVKLKGLGQKTFDKCGKLFINAIEEFLDNQHNSK